MNALNYVSLLHSAIYGLAVALILKAIIFGMLASTLGTYAFIQAGLTPIIAWSGTNVIIGGLLFGFGIVLAGGCETGWMYRAVEGQTHFWIVGIGNIIGSVLLRLFGTILHHHLLLAIQNQYAGKFLVNWRIISQLCAAFPLTFIRFIMGKVFPPEKKSLAMNH